MESTTENYLATRQPSGRFIAMEAVGTLVVFLCSAAAQDITGTSLPIDGEIGAVYCRFLDRGGLLATSWIDSERSFRVRHWSLEDPAAAEGAVILRSPGRVQRPGQRR